MNERDDFLKRIAQQKRVIQKEKDQQVTGALQKELDEIARQNEILSDPRFQKMMSIAESPELRAALEAYSEAFGSSVGDQINDKSITIQPNLAKHDNRPGGEVSVTVSLGFQMNYSTDGDYREYVTERFAPLCITWLERDERRVLHRGYGRGSSYYKGLDARAGLVILWNGKSYNSRISSDTVSGNEKVFDTEEELLNHIAHDIAKKQLQ